MPSILIIKTSSLGDVIHNLPVIEDIRAHLPRARIDWVVEERIAAVPALHPGVDRIITSATRRWRRSLLRPAAWRELGAFRRALRRELYDVIVDTQGLLKSAVMGALARGPVHGQDRNSAREPLASRLYDRAYPVPRDWHAVTRNRYLAALACGYTPPDSPPDYGIRAPAGAQPLRGLAGDYIVCLHGTARASKLWPEDHWVSLVENLVRRGLTPVLSWGGATEQRRSHLIADKARGAVVPPAPALGLKELAALIAGARAVVGVDTGLVHLAVALSRPTVAIFTDTSPALCGAFPADPSRAINLGERGVVPRPEDVLHALARLKAF